MSQEKYWQQHGSYTSDMATPGIYSPDVPVSRDSAWVQVILAGSRGWIGMASIPSHRANRATCVLRWPRRGPSEAPPESSREENARGRRRGCLRRRSDQPL